MENKIQEEFVWVDYTKKCTKCNEVKTLDMFSTRNNKPKGAVSSDTRAACKECCVLLHHERKAQTLGENLVRCGTCKLYKPITKFHSRKGQKSGATIYRTVCGECTNNQSKARRSVLLNQIREYKESVQCEDCGCADHRALQFHHINPADKSFAISEAPALTRDFELVLKEINKCMVLCANCHQILHYEERNNAEMVE